MCSIASGSTSSQKPAFFSLTLQSRSMIHSVHHHGVSRAEFSLTEPIPLQAVYIDHSRNPRLLYGSPWSRTHGRWLKEFFRPGRWVLLGRLPPSGVVLSPPLIDPPGWETHGGGSVLFPPSMSLTCPLPIIKIIRLKEQNWLDHIPTYSDPFSLAVYRSWGGLTWLPHFRQTFTSRRGIRLAYFSPGPAQ